MRPEWRSIAAWACGFAVVVAAGVLLERWWDIGDAWIGIVGVLAGGGVASISDGARRREDARERRDERAEDRVDARAQWVLDRRFSAYEEALRQLAWGSDHFWTDGDPDHPNIVQVGEAIAAVMVYGSAAAKKAVDIAPKRKEGEGWAPAYDRARVALGAVASFEIQRLAPSVAEPLPKEALDLLQSGEEA